MPLEKMVPFLLKTAIKYLHVCLSLAQIMEHYKVPDFHTALEFLSLLARRQGKLRKGGLPDTDKAAKGVLMDWTG